MTRGRLVLLATSARVAPGLLTADAWSVLREATVLAGSTEHAQLAALAAADVSVDIETVPPSRALADRLVEMAAAGGTVVWLVGADGDAELGRALPAALETVADPPEVEVLAGSYDLPGASLLDLVAVMHRLRSPGGCPWDAEQTHASLVTYLLEEAYETIEAIETGDRDHLREELGDLLLQVVFHARIAEEHPDRPWSVDDVAGDILEKLVRRHPHVFADGEADTPEHVEANWELLKAAEKGRTSAVEGVPAGLPALALASKLMARAAKAGVDVPPPDDDSLGSRLLAMVAEARSAGADAETELRAAVRRYADAVRAVENRRRRR